MREHTWKCGCTWRWVGGWLARNVLICLLPWCAALRAETVTLQSGNGAIGQPDAEITFLPSPQGSGFTDAFTASDFASALTGSAASIVAPYTGWAASLTSDSNALWVAADPNVTQSGAALYAIPFVLTQPVRTATFQLNFAVDSQLGDGTNPGVFLNGIPVTTVPIGGGDTVQSTLNISNVGSLLLTGTNVLYIYDSSGASPSGLLFGATITTSGPALNPALDLESDMGVTADNSGLVSSWADQSGSNNNATQSNQSNQPTLVNNVNTLNFLPAIQFNGSSDFLNLSAQVLTSQQFSIFAVVTDANTTTGSQEIFSNWATTDGSASVYLGTTGQSPVSVQFTDDYGGADDGGTGVGSITNPVTPFVLSALSNSGSVSVYQNGNLLASQDTPLSDRTLAGSYVIGEQGAGLSQYWSGDICAVLVYNRQLTAAEVQETTGYLGSKYGIRITALSVYPDLTVTNLSVSPTSLTTGTAVTVSWNDVNAGGAEVSGSFSDSLVVTNSNTGQTLYTFIIPYDATPGGSGPIEAGQSVNNQYAFSLPDGPPGAGTIQFTVTTDCYNQINEGNGVRTNNTATVSATSTVANYPDFAVSNIVAPADGLLGQMVQVSWTVTNQGDADEDGPWTDQVFASVDASGTNPQVLASFTFGGPLLQGQSVTRTEQVTLPASGTGSEYIGVTTNANQDFYELNPADNTLVDPQPIHIGTYDVSVMSGTSIAVAGTPITLTGTTYDPTTGDPVGDAPVSIAVLHDGTVRYISLVSGTDGTFQATFQPLPGEVGTYGLAAGQPSQTGTVAQSEFSLIGMSITPAQVTQSINPGVMVSGQATLQNLGMVPLSGIQTAVSGTASNLQIQISVPSALAGSGSTTINYTILATNDSVPRSPGVQITLTSAEGAVAVLTLDVQVVSQSPQLAANPTQLTAGVMPDAQTLVQFNLSNPGGGPTGPLTVALPPVPWISLSSPVAIDSIAAGGTTSVTLSITPPSTIAPGPYSGTISINGAGVSLNVPYQFNIVSRMTGDLDVLAVDEYTYYAAGSPKVAGATVTLTNPVTGGTAASGATDATGNATFSNLPAGYYNITAQAPSHDTYSSNVLVTAGQTNDLTAFLSRQLITYTWAVTPTTVQDQYTFNLQVTFSTDVPVPEVTVSPASLDLSTITQPATQVNFTVTNNGLIAAQNTALQFGSTANWQITPLAGNIGTLPAESSVVVPVTITNLQLAPALSKKLKSRSGGSGLPAPAVDSGGSCSISGGVNWSYPCGGQNHSYQTPVDVYNANGNCGPLGIIASNVTSGTIYTPVAVSNPVPCATPPPQVEIQVNGYEDPTLSIVRLKCDPGLLSGNTLTNHPTGRFNVNCHARLKQPGSSLPVTMVNPDGRLRFPEEGDTTKNVVLPGAGSWAPFVISGEQVSGALGDAIIQAHQGAASGQVIGTGTATVFNFSPATITVTPGGTYAYRTNYPNVPTSGTYGVRPGQAAYFHAEGDLTPAGLNCTAPGLANLQIGIVQNVLQSTTIEAYDDPSPSPAHLPPGFNVRIAESIARTRTLPSPCLDSAANAMPLYDRPLLGTQTISQDSLEAPVGCPGGMPATSNDSPAFRGTTPSLDLKVTKGTVSEYAIYPLQYVEIDDSFRTWAVTYDSDNNDIVPISETAWAVNVKSNLPQSFQQISTGPQGPPIHPPILTGPLANDVLMGIPFQNTFSTKTVPLR